VSEVQEAKERLNKQLDASLAVESVGSLIKCADLALLLASHDALEEAIDAARLEGIRLGLEAAARLAQIRGEEWEKDEDGDLLCAIAFHRHAKAVASLDPATIAKEADQ
jgi:hypothetical protein